MGRKVWLLIISALILGVFGGAWYATQPRLLAVEPPPQATAVPASTSLRLTFSRQMQPESVLQNLQIQPPQMGDFHWEGRTLVFTPSRPWPNGATVIVELSSNAVTRSFPYQRINRRVSWSFQIGYPKVLYLYPFDGRAGLYQLDPLDGSVRLLSAAEQEVFDYSLSINGATVIYSAREGNGSALYRWEYGQESVERLLVFPNGQVRAAHLSPSGQYLAYELTDLSDPNATTHVWITAYPPQRETQPIRLGANDQITRSPLWSAANLLAYYDQTNRLFRFYDPFTQQEVDTITCETGEKGAWSPDGEMFLFAEILPQGGEFPTSHLFSYHLNSHRLTDLSERNDVEDIGGVYSPQGDRLVFARKFLDAVQWTPGRQPWLLDLARREAFPLLSEAAYNHYDFAWSPDGTQILFVRFNQMNLTDPPEIWVINRDGSQVRQLVKGGFAPQWMP